MIFYANVNPPCRHGKNVICQLLLLFIGTRTLAIHWISSRYTHLDSWSKATLGQLFPDAEQSSQPAFVVGDPMQHGLELLTFYFGLTSLQRFVLACVEGIAVTIGCA